MPPIKFQLISDLGFGRLFEEFQDGHCGGHLGYRNVTILAILNLYVTVMTPIKVSVQSDLGFRRKCRFKNFKMATPAAILDIRTERF